MKEKLLVRAFHESTTGPAVIYVNGKWMTGKWIIGYYNYNPLLDRHEVFSYDDIQCYVHIVVPETICRFTGFYDSTPWQEISRDEMSSFLSTKKEDSSFNTRENWKGRMIFENDIVQYIMEDYEFDCQSVVHIGEYHQDGSDGEYRARRCYGPFVRVDNFTCLDDWVSASDFPNHYREENLTLLTSPNLEDKNRCKIIGDIFTNPEILSDTKGYNELTKDKLTANCDA